MIRQSKAFSLVEVTVAVGITAFCLLAIFGLLPVGLNANRTAYEQTVALQTAGALIADAAAMPAASNLSPIYSNNIPLSGNPMQFPLYLTESGLQTNAASARYLAILTVTPPLTTNLPVPTRLHVLMTWPASANPSLNSPGPNLRASLRNIAGSVETVGAVYRP